MKYNGLMSKQTATAQTPARQSWQRRPAVSRESILNSIVPSPEQFAIIEHVTTSPFDLIINAVAGSGKTTILKYLAAVMNTERSIFCAFSKEIQKEVEPQLRGLMEVKTTYALGFEVVRSVLFEQLKRAGDRAIDGNKYKRIAKPLCAEFASRLRVAALGESARLKATDPVKAASILALVPSEKAIAEAVNALVNHCQMNLVNPADVDNLAGLAAHHGVDMPAPLAELAPMVEKILQEGIKIAEQQGIISFSDMVWLPYALNIQPPRKFQLILVDEAQDINVAQRVLLFSLREQGGKMVFVGDRNQAIFGFASADAASFENIQKETGAAELPLSTCYRCPSNVLELAQSIVPQIRPADDAPAGAILNISESQLEQEVKTGDMIMCRMVAPLVSVCLRLIARKLPARVKGADVAGKLTRLVERIADQPGFEYSRFTEFSDRLSKKVLGKLNEDADENEMLIQSFNDEMDAVLVCYRNFIECTGVECLTAEIESIFVEGKAEIMLSTVHRAKGLEAERCFIIAPDKLPLDHPNMKAWQRQQERNLEYVAYTRVKYNRKTGFAGQLFFVA